MRPPRFPPIEKIEFYNDGIRHEGFVIKPADFDINKKYPGILEIHGGPKGTFGPVINHEMQVFAANGYFVFYCNPRGSDSRGNAFADIRGRFGKEDYSDLMAFTDAVLAQYPQLDGERLGVTGSSYGGYMSNWIITQTDRFKAAIPEASISNYVTKFLCTDIGFTYNMDNQAATPCPTSRWYGTVAAEICRPRQNTDDVHSFRSGLPLLDRRTDSDVLRPEAAWRGNPVPVVPWRTPRPADLW